MTVNRVASLAAKIGTLTVSDGLTVPRSIEYVPYGRHLGEPGDFYTILLVTTDVRLGNIGSGAYRVQESFDVSAYAEDGGDVTSLDAFKQGIIDAIIARMKIVEKQIDTSWYAAPIGYFDLTHKVGSVLAIQVVVPVRVWAEELYTAGVP